MRFNVKGNIKATKKLAARGFEIEVEAASEGHARTVAMSRLGASQSLRRNSIIILSVEAAGKAKSGAVGNAGKQ